MDKNYKQEYYNKYISVMQKLLEFEPERIKIRNKYILVFGVFFVVLFIYIGQLVNYCSDFENHQILGALLVGFSPFFIWLWGALFYDAKKQKLDPEYKIFKESVKEALLTDLLSAFNFVKKKDKINTKHLQSLLHESNVFSEFHSIWCDDVFEGVYKDTSFGVYESRLNIEEYVTSKYIKSAISIFKGIILCYQFNKPTLSNTIVTTKYDFGIKNIPSIWWIIIAVVTLLYSILFSYLCYYYWLTTEFDFGLFFISAGFILASIFLFSYLFKWFYNATYKYKKIKLEDVCFDKKFNVYSDNQVEARYLLTPSFMERFINLQTAFGTKKIKCSFVGDRIVFAISTNKDLFEIGHLFTPMKSSKQIEKLYNEIVSIIEMIDYFKLNERIGL